MADNIKPRFAVKTSNHQSADKLPETEYSAATYGTAADAVAECRKHIERIQDALRKGKI
ncbi:hypothetical protein Ae168Ps1_6343c [Pseudonocardia sp. Ae168_Ps1]|uniref:hypothetical protein n=1 Tax=unclassified Pseudonocardia TaxID=2619320 RepID=UPI000967588F|nr:MULTISPECIES: hypothetical protein [unclassified Pseudonocardia]OLL69914.1 hypothetical protein Ae150APs1_6224 [Pseudonocardia sp. Ae150A_Ps1]OLL70106.1 hypothetical protein Ae168Ps1_6343c [Pseudonocardia sp. Ae168_Ps1]OLL70377.1 hypothetical protein Ae263Ps1_6321c [Pseudonocardia sp. Ae263_Ps1]OLL89158.1 hypothetical protein Ae356Ps1_6186c [Pseudonocardia sp. Ae356_Ps1]